MMTALKSLFFLVFVPGLLVGYVPFAFLLVGPRIDTGFLAWIALPLWTIGAVTILWCFWDFLVKGCGTPAPMDPPKELVASGLYRFIRNPMYVGVLLMLFGHFLWLGYWSLLGYTAFFFIAFHLFVTGYEEPNLLKRFGMLYEKYLQEVPRWIPRFVRKSS
jgi:protein-S-isoprenylcysteine O-methyltransferase Ste14